MSSDVAESNTVARTDGDAEPAEVNQNFLAKNRMTLSPEKFSFN